MQGTSFYPSYDTAVEESDRLSALEAISLAAEQRYVDNAKHTQRVGYLSASISKAMGVPDTQASFIEQAAPLHDIGTIYIPQGILQKPEKLTSDEYEVIKTHVQIGKNMLWDASSMIIRTAKLIVETHHERWDGSGYPHGLKGNKIPRIGQIVAVADVFDTLTHDRPYRKAWAFEHALEEVMDQSGKAFDPQVVNAFYKVIKTNPNLMPLEDKALLQGQLGVIGLYDLLNSCMQNKVTGKLRLYTEHSEAIILLYQGKLIHARVDALTGEDAMVTILGKTESETTHFRLEPWKEDFPEEFVSIEIPTAQLLLRTAVKLDHSNSSFETVSIK
jgi:hypothetical protein